MRDLRSSDLRKLGGFTREATACYALRELIALFCERADHLVPSEFINWNVFSKDFRSYQGIYGSPLFHSTADQLRTEFLATLDSHPLTRWLEGNPQHTLALAMTGSIAVSDLPGQFEHSAVHREVYRHLNTRDQLTCGLGFSATGEQAYIIGFNRGRKGFSERERQLAESLALILKRCLPLIDRLERAETFLRKLQVIVGRPVVKLTPREIKILELLLAGKTQVGAARELSINQSVFRRCVGAIREKLGYSTTRMMLYELHETARHEK